MIKGFEFQPGKNFRFYAPGMDWSDRLSEEMQALGWNKAELARRSGIPYDSINKYLRGDIDQPRGDAMERLAKAIGRDVLWLRDGIETGAVPAPAANTSVPDLAIFAGMGGGGYLEVAVDAEGRPSDPDQVRGYWEFPDYMLRRFGNLKHIYAWEVKGDSMEPTLAGGAVVFVDTSQTVPPPDDIYALNYGDGLMVKRVKLVPRSDKVAIISDNDRYGVDELLREEVKIWGRVIGWFQWRG